MAVIQTGIRITERLKWQLTSIARYQGVPVNDLVIQALWEYVSSEAVNQKGGEEL